MIKIEKDVFYMSAGETCYVLKSADGKLMHVYFGKRVEPEDDLLSLGVEPSEEFSVEITAGKSTAPCGFIVDGAEVLPEKPSGELTLVGGKTLKVSLVDGVNKLRAELYYTAYSRGGYTRRTVIYNDGKKAASLSVRTAISTDMERLSACDGLSGFKAVGSADCNEKTGEAYGFLCPYLDGEVKIEKAGGKSLVGCAEEVALAPGESYYSPEILAVYSDLGIGGMSRIFHDVLRETIKGEVERSQTALFLPSMPKGKVAEAAEQACELGYDFVAVDFVKYETEIAELSKACAEAGIKLGLRISQSGIKKKEGSADLFSAVEQAIISHGIRYVLVELSGSPEEKPIAAAVYNLRARLADSSPDTVVEWGKTTKADKAAALCFPLCVMRNVVTPTGGALKSMFDYATLGLLAYAFDPTEIQEGVKRAVRAQILSYQDDAPVVMNGDLYRTEGGKCSVCVSKDKSRAYAVCDIGKDPTTVKLVGLDEHNIYRVRELNKAFSGAALMYYGITLPTSEEPTTATLHLRQVADYE